MKNIEMKVEGEILTIRINLAEDFGASRTGKTRIIASTEGERRPGGGETGESTSASNCYKK